MKMMSKDSGTLSKALYLLEEFEVTFPSVDNPYGYGVATAMITMDGKYGHFAIHTGAITNPDEFSRSRVHRMFPATSLELREVKTTWFYFEDSNSETTKSDPWDLCGEMYLPFSRRELILVQEDLRLSRNVSVSLSRQSAMHLVVQPVDKVFGCFAFSFLFNSDLYFDEVLGRMQELFQFSK